MPLTEVPPRPGRSKNWRVRGTYLGVPVDRSAGAPKRAVATALRRALERDIERGALTASREKTFVEAALAYLKGGGERRHVGPLLDHFGRMALTSITQAVVDEGAGILFPPGISDTPSPHNATLNRQVHTPVSAILAAGGLPLRLKRPKQMPGRVRWLEPDEAAVFLDAAPPKLRRFAVYLLYTGCRVTEVCTLDGGDVSRRHRLAYLPDTKSGEPRAVHLPAAVLAELAGVDLERGVRVFGYRDRWAVYDDWNPVRDALGFPRWWTPHACCHTWATWMRRYAGLDLRGLLGTGRWKDLKSVLRYTHVDTTAESRAADRLPDVRKPWSPDHNRKKTTA